MLITSRVIGTGSFVPVRAISNADVGGATRLSPQAIERLTGIRTRYWAEEGQATSDLAEAAARQACQAAGVTPATLDAVIVSTTSPDMLFPSTACLVQGRLGMSGAAAFDVSASCSGFLYALSMMDCLLRIGRYRRGLVIAAEVKSRSLDPRDPATAVLFGDGAGAVVLQAEQGSHPRGILGIRLFADGAHHAMIGVRAGGSRCPTTKETLLSGDHALRMAGRPLFRLAVKRLAVAVGDLLKEFGCPVHELHHAIFHQANGRLLAALARRVQLSPAQIYSVIDRIGNTSSASLPIALDCASREGRLRAGDLVLLGTFGGGATWATGLMRW